MQKSNKSFASIVLGSDIVIFDCDGVLVDSEVLIAQVYVEIARKLGSELAEANALARFRGRRVRECLQELAGAGFEAHEFALYELFRTRCQSLFDKELQPIAGVGKVLDALSVSVCVASSSPRCDINHALKLVGLKDYFRDDRIFSAYEIGHWKPDPLLFLTAAHRMQVKPDRCLVIEDSDVGVEAAYRAGMQVLQYCPDQPLREPHQFSSMRDLTYQVG